jgi:ketosteroid isomerase-like protein
MPQGRHDPGSPTHALFDAFAAGALDQFLDGCRDDLVLTVRGSGPLCTLVAKAEIASWYRSMQSLAGSFRSEVGLVLTEDHTQVVLMRHWLARGSVPRQYETVNRCTFRDGALASWFSYPVRADEYARAWGLHHGLERASA